MFNFPTSPIKILFDSDDLESNTCILDISIDEIDIENGRENINSELNETSTFIPTPLLKEDSEGDSLNDSLDFSLLLEKTCVELASEDLKDDIENHFETRIQLFFLQLLMTYKTERIYKGFKTYMQGGLKVKKDSNGLVEAHSCLLPGLSYKKLTDKKKIEKDGEQESFVFAANSSYEKIFNATVKLPKFVNDVDSLLERVKGTKNGNESFRGYCVRLINLNARGELDPSKAMIKFLKEGSTTIARLLEREKYKNAQNINKNKKLNIDKENAKKIVLHLYQDVISSYLDQIDDRNFFEKLALNVQWIPNKYLSLFICTNQEFEQEDLFLNTTILSEESKKTEDFYVKTQKNIQFKMNAESKLWKAFDILETRAHEIINATKTKDALMRCILFKIRPLTSKAFAMKEFASKLITGAMFCHVQTCLKSIVIKDLCIDVLNKNTTQKIIKIMKNLEFFFPTSNDLKKPKKQVNQENENRQKLINELGLTKFLTELEPAIQMATGTNIQKKGLVIKQLLFEFEITRKKSYHIEPFLNITRDWALNQCNNNLTLPLHIANCLDDEEFALQCHDLNRQIEAFVKEIYHF